MARGSFSTGYGRDLWPVLSLLVGAVAVPTACVLWFMNAAIENERLAVRQSLVDAYRAQLEVARKAVDEFWDEKSAGWTRDGAKQASVVFKDWVLSGAADSFVLYDSSGARAYPDETPLARDVSPG